MAEGLNTPPEPGRNPDPGRKSEPGLWSQCPRCREIIYTPELERNLKVCRKCNYHFRLTARERIDLILDSGSFVERDTDLQTVNPLEFDGYADSLRRYQSITNMSEAALSGEGRVQEMPVTIAVTDSHFLMGTMASVVGERITRTIERASELGIAAILVSGSGGGARMQEGLLSLMQMAKTSAALARHHRLGLMTIVVLTDPSMAGVLASWGSLGDVILTEPGAMIGFAGQRVTQQAGVHKVPSDFQTAEFQLKHGQIDRICPRRELKETIGEILAFGNSRPALPVDEVTHGG